MRTVRHGGFEISFTGGGAQLQPGYDRGNSGAWPLPHTRAWAAEPEPIGRDRQIAEAIHGLHHGLAVEIHAPCGYGKSTLLRHLARRAANDLDAPVVHLSVPAQRSADEVLESVLVAAYQMDSRPGPDPERGLAQLRGSRVVIILDDLSLDPRQIAHLLDRLTGCQVVLASTRPLLGQHGVSVPLFGLPESAAVTLVRDALGRPLAHHERAALTRLTRAIDGQPLRLRRATALVHAGNHSFAELATLAERDAAELDRLSLDALTQPERRLLATLAFTAGTLLPKDLLDAIGDAGRVDEALADLRRRELVEKTDDHFGLPVCQADSYRRLLYRYFDLAGAARDIADYLTVHDQPLSAVNAALTLIEYAAERGQWTVVIRLVRVAEPALVLAARWQTAHRVIELGIQAAQATRDMAAEALFTHEQGTLALCRDDIPAARALLHQALRLREQMGDPAGAALTRQNLAFTTRTPMPPTPPAQPAPPARSGNGPAPLRRPLAVAVLVLTIMLAGLGAVAGASGDNPPIAHSTSSPPTPSATPETPPPPRTNPTRTQPPTTGPPATTPQVRPPRITPSRGAPFAANITPRKAPAIRRFTISNPNTNPITLARLAVTGGPAYTLAAQDCDGATLAHGEACRVTVTFAPTTLGTQHAKLVVADGTGHTTTADLRGTGYLTLTLKADGSGELTAGANTCRRICHVTVTNGRLLVEAKPVQPTPNTGAPQIQFLRWDECPGTVQAATCTPNLTADANVTAVFRIDIDID